MNLSMSHVVTNRILNKLGVGHDMRVKDWCDVLTIRLRDGHTQVGLDLLQSAQCLYHVMIDIDIHIEMT